MSLSLHFPRFTVDGARRAFLVAASFLSTATVVAFPSVELSRFSNGVFELAPPSASIAVDAEALENWSDSDDSSLLGNSGELNDSGVFGKLGAFDAASTVALDDFSPLDAPRSADATRSEATFNGSSFSFSQDVVVRGSVRLPELKSFQFWGNGYLGSGEIRPEKWRGEIDANATGAQVGVNMPMGALNFTAYYNYHRNDVKYVGRKICQNDHMIGAGVYLHAGPLYFTALANYGDDGYKAKGGDVGSASYDGYQAAGYFETGYEMHTLGLFVLKPFGSYQYAYLEHDNFNPNSLRKINGDKRDYDACYMTLGSRIDVNLAGLDSFTLQGRMAWVTQLRSKNESIQNYCFGRVPGTFAPSSPYYQGEGAGDDFFWGGVGLRLSLWGALAIAGDYDCLVSKEQTFHIGSLGLLFGF